MLRFLRRWNLASSESSPLLDVLDPWGEEGMEEEGRERGMDGGGSEGEREEGGRGSTIKYDNVKCKHILT